MDFMEAVGEMRKGKKVKRFGRPIIGFYDTEILHDEYGGDVNFIIKDFEATDWEVVDKDNQWNLGDLYHYDTEIKIEDVKKCRDLILNDIENYSAVVLNDKMNISSMINKRFGDLK